MAQDRAKQLLQQGIAATKAGDKDEARQLLQQAVRLDPQNENVWLWLSSVARDDKERIFCLKQILEINPKNELAIKGLKALGVQKSQVTQPPAAVPMVSGEKLADMEDEVDEFIRTYSAEPRTVLDVEWVKKSKKRYSEGAARRLRRTILASTAAVLMLVAAGIILLLLSLDVELPAAITGEDQLADRASLTPSNTPTVTPTSTPGAANTATPIPAVTNTPIDVPANLPRGNIFETTPTPANPPYDINVRRPVETAVFYYAIGEYDDTIQIVSTERAALTDQCFWELYYFEALALTDQDQFEAAVSTLQDGIFNNPDCATGIDAAMLQAGLCRTHYEQAINNPSLVDTELLMEARTECENALALENNLPPALLDQARIDIAMFRQTREEPYYTSADELLTNALRQYQSNVDLMLAQADLYMANNQPYDALVPITRALTINPASPDALRKRAEAQYLIALNTIDNPDTEVNEELLSYGTLALSAQDYLLMYAGDPVGYMLLAVARLNEGKPLQALENVNRVLAAEDDLPPSAAESIVGAYSLRAQINYNLQNWEEAQDDLEQLRELDPANPAWIDLQTDVALKLGDYETVLDNLSQALNVLPERTDVLLVKSQLLSQTCQYDRNFECDYEAVLTDLTDEMLNTLEGTQRGDALLYRAEAEFALLDDEDLSDNERTARLESILSTVNNAIRLHQTPDAYYLLGRIQQELDAPEQALRAFEWVAYWTQYYSYPFADEISAAIEDLSDELDTSNS